MNAGRWEPQHACAPWTAPGAKAYCALGWSCAEAAKCAEGGTHPARPGSPAQKSKRSLCVGECGDAPVRARFARESKRSGGAESASVGREFAERDVSDIVDGPKVRLK